jgi:hypothetical protein
MSSDQREWTKMLGSIVVVFGMVCAVGCNAVDTRSGAFDCETLADCQAPRTCVAGHCVLSAADLPDADPSAPDADPNAPDADTNLPDAALPQVGPCATCQGGTCDETCEGALCLFSCPVDSCSCDFSCSAAATSCEAGCGLNATCTLDCQGPADCRMNCEGSTACEVDCTGASRCDKTKCANGSACLIRCGGTAPCIFKQCDGTELSCPGDIVVCNRACP